MQVEQLTRSLNHNSIVVDKNAVGGLRLCSTAGRKSTPRHLFLGILEDAMAFQAVPDTISVVPTFMLPNSQVAQNVLNFVVDGPITLANMALAALAYETWVAEFLDQVMSSQCSLQRVVVKDLSTENGFIYDYDLPTPVVGTNGAAVLPSNVSACIKFNTGLSGKSQRGRVYHVGLSETMVSSDYVNVGILNSLVDMYQELRTEFLGLSMHHTVVSRYHNNALRPTGVTTDVVSYSAVTTRVASQRRRLPRPGQGS